MKNKVKCSFNVQSSHLNSLREMVLNHEIASMNSGLDEAIKVYIKNKKKKIYEEQMERAVHDSEFMRRLQAVMSDDIVISEKW